MSTRAVITFRDEDESFSVYQHFDGDPATVAANVDLAKEYAWPLPRFEACDFAAAYIRATKKSGGNIYFSNGAESHDDLLHAYVVSLNVETGYPEAHLSVKGFFGLTQGGES